MKLYYLAILPPEPIRSEIKDLKNEMKSQYGPKHALKSPAHITLQMPFKRDESIEGLLIENLANFANQNNPFKVNIKNFDCFEPRVIFLKVDPHEQIRKVHNDLKSLLKSKMNFEDKELNSQFHPHITIATRDLKKDDFEEIWNDYQSKKYQAEFLANQLTLLKHNASFWEIYKEFPFKN